MIHGRTRATTFKRGPVKLVTEDGYDVDDARDAEMEDNAARQLAAVTEEADATGLKSASKGQVLRAMRVEGYHYVSDKRGREEVRDFFDVANSHVLGIQVLNALDKDEHTRREKEHALQRSLKTHSALHDKRMAGPETGASVAASAFAAVSAAHKQANDTSTRMHHRDALQTATQEALEYIEAHGGSHVLAPTAHTRWMRRQARHKKGVCGTWLYGDNHVHYDVIAPGVRVEISKPLAAASVQLQKRFRGMQARKQADRQWSDEVQHSLRAMRTSIRGGNVRERRRMGHKMTHWAQQQLGLLGQRSAESDT